MRHFGSNSDMQTLELMWLSDHIRGGRSGGSPNPDFHPKTMLKFMGMAAMLAMVFMIPRQPAGSTDYQERSSQEQSVTRPTVVDPPSFVGGEPQFESQVDPLRTWTDSSGKYRAEASLVELMDDSVRLQKADGRRLCVPVNRLSVEDRAYVREARHR